MIYVVGNGGCTLDGVAAKDLNIVMGRDSDRPIVPGTIDRFLSIPGRNGISSFGSDVGARYFNLSCNVITRDYRTLQSAIERIASVLLDGYGRPRTIKLVFDVRPDRYYLVRYSGSLGIDRLFGFGQFTLPLVTVGNPFARSLDSSDGIILDSDIPLDSDILLDDGWSYPVNGSAEIDIHNWGTMIVKPTIEISGSLADITIQNYEKQFTYHSEIQNSKLIINSERMTVKVENNNMLSKVTGDFIELHPGFNKILITGTSLVADVSFIFQASYF